MLHIQSQLTGVLLIEPPLLPYPSSSLFSNVTVSQAASQVSFVAPLKSARSLLLTLASTSVRLLLLRPGTANYISELHR